MIPQMITDWIIANNFNKWMFFLLVNILLFILGTFLEGTSIILITIPLFLPILHELGINLYHFAIMVTVNLELAMITPPVGLNLFVVSGISKEPVGKVVKGVLPFLVLMILVLAVIVIWPDLSLFLIQK
jgi:C4-dicarboxylate transporter DctM subunit